MSKSMNDNIVSLADLIEQRLRKQQELDFYKESLEQLQKKIAVLGKEVDITTLIIDMIEGERVLTLDEKRGNILLLNDKKDKRIYKEIYNLSYVSMIPGIRILDITDGATHYHADYVFPAWRKSKTKTVEIGDHIFYRWEK